MRKNEIFFTQLCMFVDLTQTLIILIPLANINKTLLNELFIIRIFSKSIEKLSSTYFRTHLIHLLIIHKHVLNSKNSEHYIVHRCKFMKSTVY